MSNADFIPRKDEDFLRWFLRKLKRAVNKVSPLRGLTGNRQSRQGKPLSCSEDCRIAIRRQAYPVNNPRIYPGVNAASPTMNAGGVTLLCMCKTPKGQRLPAFVRGEERRLPPDKSGGYSQDTPAGVPQCGNKQVVRISKPRRGNTLLTGCFSFRLRQASLIAQPRRGDTLLIRRQAYPVNNPRIYPGANVASSQMNAGGVTLLCMCKTPKWQRHPAFVEGEKRRLPPDKSGGYSQDTPDGVRIMN